jgi:hypothetical protein
MGHHRVLQAQQHRRIQLIQRIRQCHVERRERDEGECADQERGGQNRKYA